MKARTLVGGMFALLWLTALPTWAAEYRLQVANIDDHVFASYEGKAPSFWSMKEPMERLAERLDDNQFSRNAILPGHHVELVQDPAYGEASRRKTSPCSRRITTRGATRTGPRMSSTPTRGIPWFSW
jgi:hypothetical protein